jgi:hypothetical protein
MNICIIPKPYGILNNNIKEENDDAFFISASVSNALNEMKTKIDHLLNYYSELSEICKVCNPHEYVFSNIMEQSNSVSKITPPSNLYYELYEICNTFGIFKQNIQSILHVGEESNTIRMLFKNSIDIDIQQFDNNYKRVDLIICDQITSKLNLNTGGNAIIKLPNITSKSIVHALYAFSSLFEKTILVKPAVINVLSNDVFVLGLSFLNELRATPDTLQLATIPSFFIYKIEEFNSINGHRQLDAYEQVLNVFYNKNKTSKLDVIKKNSIQKSMDWCDKQNIPYNKCGERVNLFL